MNKRTKKLLAMMAAPPRLRRVSGLPPLSYTAKKAGFLTDYRIYGNTQNGEAVGDLVTSGEHAGEYNVPVTVSNGTDTLTTPIYLPEQIKKVGDEAEYIDYGEQKQHRVRANLFDMKKFAETASPVSATVNYSGNSLMFTPTQYDAYVNEIYSNTSQTIPSALIPACINVQPLTAYTITMNSPYKCYISWLNDSFTPVSACTTIPKNQPSYTFTTPENCTKLLFRLGKYVDSISYTFTISDIMLNLGSTPFPYEPYIENTDLDVTLPALPTVAGTNVLSVGTEVQPSLVEVTGRIRPVPTGGGE